MKSASGDEAAAIAAAIQRFIGDHAPNAAPETTAMSPWLRAGLLDATGHREDDFFGELPH